MLAQLDDFRNLPDEACFFNEETTKVLASLLELNKSSQSLFEFKLLEKERVFPGEKFNLKTDQINIALNSIDFEREEIEISHDIEDRLKSLTIQEELIEKRDEYNQEINKKFEQDELDFPEKPQVKNFSSPPPLFYNLAETRFDEEKTLNEAKLFLNELQGENNNIEIETDNEKAVFNKDVMKNRMRNEEGKPDLKKIQEKLSMLSFYEDLNN